LKQRIQKNFSSRPKSRKTGVVSARAQEIENHSIGGEKEVAKNPTLITCHYSVV
jgi:hypothetical protein